MMERDRKREGLSRMADRGQLSANIGSSKRESSYRTALRGTGHAICSDGRSPGGMTRLMNDEDAQLRDLLRTLSPSARERLRDVLSRDQVDRDLIAARLLRFRDVRGAAWADLIDELSLDPELRRRCVRLLGELTSSS